MSTSTLNIGFVGGAPNSAAGYAHFVASRLDRQWDLQAGVFSTHADINKNAAETYGVSEDRTYESLTELLERETGKLDAVAILTPTPLHHEMVITCLKAGIPVICEKALALSSAEIQQIIQVRNEVHGFLAVTFNYSGYPMVREMREMIRKGLLGKILHFQAEMPQEETEDGE